MITPELITYIQKQLAAGVSKESIARSLAPNGWSPQDMAQAFVAASKPQSGISVPLPTTTVSPNKIARQSSSTGMKVILSIVFVMVSAVYAFFQYVVNPQQAPAVATSLPTSQQNLPASSPTPDISSPPVVQSTQPQSGNTPTIANQTPAASAPPPQQTSTPASVQNTPAANQTQTTTTPPPVQTPAPKPAGQYANGSYTGSSADAYYGTVQVKAVIQNGALADVQFLQYPNDRRTSQYINSQAMPALTSEAIQVQSANVDIVSGATFTSQAFQQSLSSALAQAKN